jgi:hypothetical protein
MNCILASLLMTFAVSGAVHVSPSAKPPHISHHINPGDGNAALLLIFLGVPALILFIWWFRRCVKESNGSETALTPQSQPEPFRSDPV